MCLTLASTATVVIFKSKIFRVAINSVLALLIQPASSQKRYHFTNFSGKINFFGSKRAAPCGNKFAERKTLQRSVIPKKMLMLRIYFDNCCYNRPFDDQSDILVRLESDAKLYIQELVKDKQLELVWSFVLDYENSVNPFADKRERIQAWHDLAVHHCAFSAQIEEKAQLLMNLGMKQMDASHIACAILSQADYFITTDKKVLNKSIPEIQIVNPMIFIERWLHAN
jgi:predicted nucleic acid-binding protein